MNADKMNNIISDKFLIYASTLIIILVYSPYFILGEDSHIRVNDNLDSCTVWTLMALNTSLTPWAITEQMMGGIPIFTIGGIYDINMLLTYFFGSYWGYALSRLLMSFAGFWGMYFLLRKYCLPKDCPSYIIIGCSLLFSILPLWGFKATLTGAPFVIYAFLNLRNKEKDWYNWIIFIVYAFFSSMVLLGIFIMLFFSIVLLYDLIKTKKFNWILFLGLVTISITYSISHIQLLYAFLGNSGFESVRKSFVFDVYSFKDVIYHTIRLITFSDEHAWSFTPSKQFPVILLCVTIAFLFYIKNKSFNKLYLFIVFIIFITSLMFPIWSSEIFSSSRELVMVKMPIDLRRVYWIQPVCWYILLGLSLYTLHKSLRIGYILAGIVLLLQFGILVKSQEYFAYSDLPTFRNFFAKIQFEDIKKYINKDVDTYGVVSMGIHPSIAQYNGFYTVDGFSNNYPLEYKYKFRRIIEKELDKDPVIKEFYDNWGGWCYLYWNNYDINDYQLCRNNVAKIEDHLDFDYDVLKEMGGEYIISSIKIDTDNNKRLQLLKVFDNYKDSHWTIYLYEIV